MAMNYLGNKILSKMRNVIVTSRAGASVSATLFRPLPWGPDNTDRNQMFLRGHLVFSGRI